MAKQSATPAQNLLDAVRPAEADGPLRSAVHSTYGLSLDQPNFFEHDFLPTLLSLGGVRDRGYVAPVARERKLAECERPSKRAKHIDLVGSHWSGKHHAVVRGINLVTAVWSDGDRLYPCDYRVYHKASDDKTKNDHFADFVAAAHERGFTPAPCSSTAGTRASKTSKSPAFRLDLPHPVQREPEGPPQPRGGESPGGATDRGPRDRGLTAGVRRGQSVSGGRPKRRHGSGPCSLPRGVRGKTATPSRSTAGCGTSSSTTNGSRPWARRRSKPRTGGTTSTPRGRTVPSATRRRGWRPGIRGWAGRGPPSKRTPTPPNLERLHTETKVPTSHFPWTKEVGADQASQQKPNHAISKSGRLSLIRIYSGGSDRSV